MSTGDSSNGRSVGPHVGPSTRRDPAKNAERHGAYSPSAVAKIKDGYLDSLKAAFPKADVTILGLQATRLAQLELVGAWLDGKGIIRNKRFGTIWPAAEYWGKVASAFERQHERLEAQEREVSGGRRSVPTIAEIMAEGDR